MSKEDMMRDEYFDRDYQAGRAALNDAIVQLGRTAMASFRVLSAIQFNAPWQAPRAAPHKRAGSACH